MKFKVGDRFVIGHGSRCLEIRKGVEVTVTSLEYAGDERLWINVEDAGGNSCGDTADHFDFLPIKQGEPTTGRRTFRLLKDIPDFKKGLIVQEKCDDGDQEYISINGREKCAVEDFEDYFHGSEGEIKFSRQTVENQPKWFQEVFPATQEYLTKDELKAFKEWQKKRK